MKIAILTQPLRKNYGGILQAYALQKKLKDLGHKVVTIDRIPNKEFPLKNTLRKLKKITLNIIANNNAQTFSDKQLETIYQNTTDFIKNNIALSKTINTDKGMHEYFSTNKFDAFVVGSDQTWRPRYSPNIYNYFLDFLTHDDCTKIAYASSFGVDSWEYDTYQTAKCSTLANKFDAISVREQFGVELCNNYLKVHAEFVLDPTLLLEKNEYLKLIDATNESPNKGKLLAYVLDESKENSEIINNISKTLGLDTFKNQAKSNIEHAGNADILDYAYPTVGDWIKGFIDADFIITDSYHGTVFSIIFNKKFITIANRKRGAARFESLLNCLDLNERLIDNTQQIPNDLLHKEINYEEVNSKLSTLKKSSLAFLEKNLSPK